MERQLLDLDLLQRAVDRAGNAASFSEYSGPLLTRRQMIGISTMAAAGFLPTIRALGAVVRPAFEVRGDKRRVTFLLDGQERWTIDTRRFAGRPRLEWARRERNVHVRLEGARYPGTSIPADLEANVKFGLVGWTLELAMTFGDFNARVPFLPWLEGSSPARSLVDLGALTLCAIGPAARLTAGGVAEAEMAPSWDLLLRGSGIVSVAGIGETILSDTLLVSMPNSIEAAPIALPVSRRTALRLERGRRSWMLQLPSDPVWRLDADGSTFDRLRIDAGESAAGRQVAGFIASNDADRVLTVVPCAGFAPSDGRPGLPLGVPHYAAAFDGTSEQRALVARLSERPVWLDVGAASIEVGGGEGVPPLMLMWRNGQLERSECTPRLNRTYVPVAGAHSEPHLVDENLLVPFASVPSRTMRDATWVKVGPNGQDDPAEIQRLRSAVITILRPEDLLHLRIAFDGLEIATDGGKSIVRRDGEREGLMVVKFPPQHVAEEVFTASPSEAARIPIRLRSAGRSRIAFRVPEMFSSMELTTENLLQAMSLWELNLAPVAVNPGSAIEFVDRSTSNAAQAPDNGRDRGRGAFINVPTRPQTRVLRELGVESRSVGAGNADDRVVPMNTVPVRRRSTNLSSVRPRQEQVISAERGREISRLPLEFQLTAPKPTETALEIPYRLILSPTGKAAWAHATGVVDHGGRCELWHTRLGTRASDSGIDEVGGERTLRAIWALDPGFSVKNRSRDDDSFRDSLGAETRWDIVQLTCNGQLRERRPLYADRLMLSALGSWIQTRGFWPPTASGSPATVQWDHRASMGRDSYVKIVKQGVIFPFGHHAVRIDVIERKIEPAQWEGKAAGSDGGVAAILRVKTYLKITEPERTFPATADPAVDRQMPFRRVLIRTEETPAIRAQLTSASQPDSADQTAGSGKPFVAYSGNEPFLFTVEFEDIEGQISEVKMPLAFIVGEYSSAWSTVRDDFERPLAFAHTMSTAPFGLQRVAMAEQPPEQPSSSPSGASAQPPTPIDLSFEAAAIRFSAKPGGERGFVPVVHQARLAVPSIKRLAGTDTPVLFKYSAAFCDNGFSEENRDRQMLFDAVLEFDKDGKPQMVTADFASRGDQSGALVTPNFMVAGLSRTIGPIGGTLANPPGTPTKDITISAGVTGKTFDPKLFFGEALDKARIFGAFSIWDIVEEVGLDEPIAIPSFVADALDAVTSFFSGLRDVRKALETVPEPPPAKPGDGTWVSDALREERNTAVGIDVSPPSDYKATTSPATLPKGFDSAGIGLRTSARLLAWDIYVIEKQFDGLLATTTGGQLGSAIDVLAKAFVLLLRDLADVIPALQQDVSAASGAAGQLLSKLGNLESILGTTADMLVAAVTPMVEQILDDLLARVQAELMQLLMDEINELRDCVTAALPVKTVDGMQVSDISSLNELVREADKAAGAAKEAIKRIQDTWGPQLYEAVGYVVGDIAKGYEMFSRLPSRVKDPVKYGAPGASQKQRERTIFEKVTVILDFIKSFASLLDTTITHTSAIVKLGESIVVDLGLASASSKTELPIFAELRSRLKLVTGLEKSLAALNGLIGMSVKRYFSSNVEPDGDAPLFRRCGYAGYEPPAPVGGQEAIAALKQLITNPTDEFRKASMGILMPALAVLDAALAVAGLELNGDGEVAAKRGGPKGPDLNSIPYFTGALALLGSEIGKVTNLVGAIGLSPEPEFVTQIRRVGSTIQDIAGKVQGITQDAMKIISMVEAFVNGYEMVREGTVKFDWKPPLKSFALPGKTQNVFIAENAKPKKPKKAPAAAGETGSSGSESSGDTTATSTAPAATAEALTPRPASFVLAVQARMKASGKNQAGFEVNCSMENFTLDLVAGYLSFIKLYFNKIQFLVKSGKKPDINVELAYLEFTGPLTFVESLRRLIPLDGFSDPPAVDVSKEGIRASFAISIPTLAFGVFALKNISLGAGLSVPFIGGDPLAVSFNFCTRDQPFQLTVSMFGGGGFFQMVLTPKGVHLMEAAFEFGGALSFDCGVASGGVEVMAGIYFKMQQEELRLEGYLRLGGKVQILGVVSASIELYMELTYDSKTEKCTGRATLTIEVTIALVSVPVKIEAERKFAGSNGDPSFLQVMQPYTYELDPARGTTAQRDPWEEYCTAFGSY